jgi:hypothetical protein
VAHSAATKEVSLSPCESHRTLQSLHWGLGSPILHPGGNLASLQTETPCTVPDQGHLEILALDRFSKNTAEPK